MKIQYVLDALKAGKNKFTVNQLTDVIRADAGDKALARRTRRALFVARKAGIVLEPIRDGKTVTAYQLSGALPDLATVTATTRKASRARTKTVSAKTISKEVAAVVAKNKAPSKKNDDAVRAKNLATIKAVHAKTKQNVAKHPITGRDLTDEQADVLEEFRALESAWETEEQDRAFARAAVRENLKKEAYVE